MLAVSTALKDPAIVFGIGAIGSHVGSLLSRSGVGDITLVDGFR